MVLCGQGRDITTPTIFLYLNWEDPKEMPIEAEVSRDCALLWSVGWLNSRLTKMRGL